MVIKSGRSVRKGEGDYGEKDLWQWRIQRGGPGGHAPPPIGPCLVGGKILTTAHQMSDFKAKMHQIRFRLGRSPRPRLQIGFINILDMILSRASGGSAPGAWTPLGT